MFRIKCHHPITHFWTKKKLSAGVKFRDALKQRIKMSEDSKAKDVYDVLINKYKFSKGFIKV